MGRLDFCYVLKVISLSAILFSLAGCHSRSNIKDDDPSPLPTRVASAQDPGTKCTFQKLTKCGIKVISIGQDYLISVPSKLVFADQSPRIRRESYAVLNDVVCYMKQFRKISVDVSAFSSKYVSPDRERALTAARARAVADYLWAQDIDSRFVFTRGLGSDKPIIFNMKGGDASPNSRIEITFRNAVA